MSKKPAAEAATEDAAIAPVAKQNTSIVAPEFERDAGEGFEGTDQDSYAVPFLTILQDLSPQVKVTKPEYIAGARPGMFYNNATQEIYPGDTGILLVTADFQRRLVEWIPRDDGGGYVGSHRVDDIDLTKLQREGGKWKMNNGHELQDTRNHMCLLLTDAGPQPVVVRFASTQIKKSRHWWTAMKALRARGKGGKSYVPATYMSIWRFTTVEESNAKGSWSGFKFSLERMLDIKATEEGVEGPDADVYYMAKEFREQLADGRVKIEPPQEGGSEGQEDDVPF